MIEIHSYATINGVLFPTEATKTVFAVADKTQEMSNREAYQNNEITLAEYAVRDMRLPVTPVQATTFSIVALEDVRVNESLSDDLFVLPDMHDNALVTDYELGERYRYRRPEQPNYASYAIPIASGALLLAISSLIFMLIYRRIYS